MQSCGLYRALPPAAQRAAGMIYALFLVGVSAVLALWLHPSIARWAQRAGAVDVPDERKKHLGPIPRAGGTTILVAAVLTFGVGALSSDWIAHMWRISLPNPHWVALAGLSMWLLGAVDDVHRLRAGPKASVQACAALLTWYAGVRVSLVTNPLGGTPLPVTDLSLPITVLWIMIITNAFNLVDGLDGLASGLAAIAMIGYSLVALVRGETATLYLIAPFLGALIGFAPYNFPRATAFLGDSGSYLLGYMLAVLSLLGNQKSATALLTFAPLLFVGLPIVDVLATMLRRFVASAHEPMLTRIRIMFQPDRRHLHHLLVDSGVESRRATLTLAGVSTVLSLCGLGALLMTDRRLALFLALLGLIFLLLVVAVGAWLTSQREASPSDNAP